jgi:hypothetical protein
MAPPHLYGSTFAHGTGDGFPVPDVSGGGIALQDLSCHPIFKLQGYYSAPPVQRGDSNKNHGLGLGSASPTIGIAMERDELSPH